MQIFLEVKLSIIRLLCLNPLTILAIPLRILHINENGFVSFDTDTSKPYDNAGINNLSSGNNRGGFPLQYFDETKHFEGGNSPMDGSLIPEKWGKPGTSYEGNFDNSIFALLGGYNTEDYNGETNWSIRTLWNSATKIFTVGWYNLRSGKSTEDNAEVNLEIQFNMNDDSFKIVHGKFGGRFPDATTNADSGFSQLFHWNQQRSFLFNNYRGYLCL